MDLHQSVHGLLLLLLLLLLLPWVMTASNDYRDATQPNFAFAAKRFWSCI